VRRRVLRVVISVSAIAARKLAEINSARYLPDLAMALKSLSIGLAELGRRKEAKAAYRESRDLYQQFGR